MRIHSIRLFSIRPWADPVGWQGIWTFPGKSQVAIIKFQSLNVLALTPLEKQLDLFSRGSVRPSVKYVDD